MHTYFKLFTRNCKVIHHKYINTYIHTLLTEDDGDETLGLHGLRALVDKQLTKPEIGQTRVSCPNTCRANHVRLEMYVCMNVLSIHVYL